MLRRKHFFIVPSVFDMAVIISVARPLCMPRSHSQSNVGCIVNCFMWWYVLTEKMWTIKILLEQLLSIVWVDILVHSKYEYSTYFCNPYEKCHVITALQKVCKLMSNYCRNCDFLLLYNVLISVVTHGCFLNDWEKIAFNHFIFFMKSLSWIFL